ncbi:hypothetical protein QBC39DRAFT_356594 [Podospora conica]|nr:hypothetical protein QBC39DRAFT_356594 [Schizothecium conicum]
MLDVEQEIRKYAQEDRPSLSLPQTHSDNSSYAEMLTAISTAASRLARTTNHVKYQRDTVTDTAIHEIYTNPHLQPHLDLWGTSQFWDLVEELRVRDENLREARLSSLEQQVLNNNDVDVHHHLTALWDSWITQAFHIEAAQYDPKPGRYYLEDLEKWAQEAKYFERHLAIRLVCPRDTGTLDLQIGNRKFSISRRVGYLVDQRSHLLKIVWPDFEPWPGMSATRPSDAVIPKSLGDFKRCVLSALKEAHISSGKGNLLDVKTLNRLLVDENGAREEVGRELGDLKVLFSACSFLRALVPQERVWEEIELH